MSADNGVYIGRFPTDEGFEYRVAYAQAIENTDYRDYMRWMRCDEEAARREAAESILLTFGARKVFVTEEDAWKEAALIHGKMEWTEYGVSLLEFDRPFPT